MENGNGTAESAYANVFNVRNQFTMWGPDSQINDYAARHYSGLMLYYRFAILSVCYIYGLLYRFDTHYASPTSKYFK